MELFHKNAYESILSLCKLSIQVLSISDAKMIVDYLLIILLVLKLISKYEQRLPKFLSPFDNSLGITGNTDKLYVRTLRTLRTLTGQ